MTIKLKTDPRRALFFIAALLAEIFLFRARLHAQQTLPLGANASDFSSIEYFDEPNQQQPKSEISGASAQPIEGGLLLIKQVKLEKFLVTGKSQFVVTAPECIFNPMNGQASSPGEVHMQTGDGQLRIDGQGFLWRQNESFLIISNHVQTIVDKAPVLTP